MFERTQGCVPDRTHPLAEISHKMKSLSPDKRKALIISLSKITSCITPLYAYHYTGVNAALSVEIPASQNVHLTKQVFEELPLGAKLKYLLGGQYQPQSSFDLPGLSKLKSHLAQTMTDTALSKIKALLPSSARSRACPTQLDSSPYLSFTQRHTNRSPLSNRCPRSYSRFSTTMPLNHLATNQIG
jgi:hypothetical protein